MRSKKPGVKVGVLHDRWKQAKASEQLRALFAERLAREDPLRCPICRPQIDLVVESHRVFCPTCHWEHVEEMPQWRECIVCSAQGVFKHNGQWFCVGHYLECGPATHAEKEQISTEQATIHRPRCYGWYGSYA